MYNWLCIGSWGAVLNHISGSRMAADPTATGCICRRAWQQALQWSFHQMYEHVGRLEKELPVPVVRLKAEKDFELLMDKSKGSPVRESLLEKAVCQCPLCGLDHGNSICGYGKRVA